MNINKVLSQIRTRGLQKTIRALVYRANVRFQEWRFGIHTEGVIDLSELGIDGRECKYYSPTEYASFRQIIRALGINPRDHVFLDFGAGMGRAVILAATYPFRRVVGVEISQELTNRAEENLTQCKGKLRCHNVEIVTGDAATYTIPTDVSIVYFNNPFFGEILSSVLANLRGSLKTLPREMILVCNLPPGSAFESQISSHDWLQLERQFLLREGRLCLIYSGLHTDGKHRSD